MGVLVLIIGLAVFLGIHSVRIFAPGWREARIAAMGDNGWRGIYSLVSLAGLILIIWGYSLAQSVTAVLYVTPFWMVHLNILLMALSFVAMAVFAAPAGRLKAILKHPMLLSVKLWAVAHLLVNGDVASILLFGTFLVWAIADRISVKRRGTPIAEPGPVRNDLIAVVAGLVAWVVFIWGLHAWLFGVPVPIA